MLDYCAQAAAVGLEVLRCRALGFCYETDCCLKAMGQGSARLMVTYPGLRQVCLGESLNPEQLSPANGTRLSQGEGSWSDLALSLLGLPLARVMGSAVSLLGAAGKRVACCWLNACCWYFGLFSWSLGKRRGNGAPTMLGFFVLGFFLMGSKLYSRMNVVLASRFSIFMQRVGKTQVKAFMRCLPFI